MKEQVILDRDEYLQLKEMADKNNTEIKQEINSAKGYFLKQLFNIIYDGVYDGHHEVLWGKSKDWIETKDKLDDTLCLLKKNIERESWEDALGCLNKSIQAIVKDNRLHVENEELTNQIANEVRKNIAKFNSLPWYKKMFFKIW